MQESRDGVRIADYEAGRIRERQDLDELASELIRERRTLLERVAEYGRRLRLWQRQAIALGAIAVIAMVVAGGLNVAKAGIVDERGKLQAKVVELEKKAPWSELPERIKWTANDPGAVVATQVADCAAWIRGECDEATKVRDSLTAVETQRDTLLEFLATTGDGVPVPSDKVSAWRQAIGDGPSAAPALAALLRRLDACSSFDRATRAFFVDGKDGARFCVAVDGNGFATVRADGGGAVPGAQSSAGDAKAEPLGAVAARGPLFVGQAGQRILLFDGRHPDEVRELIGCAQTLRSLAIGSPSADGRRLVVGLAEKGVCYRWQVGEESEPVACKTIDTANSDPSAHLAVGTDHFALLSRVGVLVIEAAPPGGPSGATQAPKEVPLEFAIACAAASTGDWLPADSALAIASTSSGLTLLAPDGANGKWTAGRQVKTLRDDRISFDGAWFTGNLGLIVRRGRRFEQWQADAKEGRGAIRAINAFEIGVDMSVRAVEVRTTGPDAAIVVIVAQRDGDADRLEVTRWRLHQGGASLLGQHCIVDSSATRGPQVFLTTDGNALLVGTTQRGFRLQFGPLPPMDVAAGLDARITGFGSAKDLRLQ